VGGNDKAVLQLNRQAFVRLTVEKELVIVPGATHLFEEPGALEDVARLATQWFKRYLHRVSYQVARRDRIVTGGVSQRGEDENGEDNPCSITLTSRRSKSQDEA